MAKEKWMDWVIELQALAQAGITYTKDAFDLERFERIREICAEIVCAHTDLSMEKVTELFCTENGYQTPKLDSRAAIIQNGKILLVQEKNGKWSLPGGWVDVNQSIGSNTIKESLEEAGAVVVPKKLVAVQDRRLHNQPEYLYGVCKIFVLCEYKGGRFEKNIETIGTGWFEPDRLPPMAEEKNTHRQVQMCFDAYANPGWEVQFD